MQPDSRVNQLVEQARRNEKIQRRLDQVEQYLLENRSLGGLVAQIGPLLESLYGLDVVNLVLAEENRPMAQASGQARRESEPQRCFLRPRSDMRLLLGDLDRPFLSNRLNPELIRCFFPGKPKPASAAVLPMWARGDLLGALAMGSLDGRRFSPELETHFLQRLGRKAATGLDAALMHERVRYHEKREAAVEMAGAACHNLAQPLTTVNMILAKLRRGCQLDAEATAFLDQMENELDRLGDMVQRISQVSEYVTEPYAQGLKIIDLDSAGAG